MELYKLALVALFGTTATLAQAQIFVCKDANGRTLTSDRPIPECANRSMKELRSNGLVKRDIPAPLSPEQVRLQKEAEEKKKTEDAAAAEQRRRDEVLLNTYKNEQQIEAERQRSITQLRNNINIALIAKGVAEQRYKLAQSEANVMRQKGELVPAPLRTRLEDAEKSIAQESKNAEEMEAELAKSKAKFDDITRRYKAVVSGGKEDGKASAAATSGKK